MAEHERSASVDAPASRLFDYLSDIQNLPRYFDSMTSAEPAGGEAVGRRRTSMVRPWKARLWFRVDDNIKRLVEEQGAPA